MKCLTNNWKTQQITFFEKPFSNLLLKEVCWCFEMWVDFTEVKVDASMCCRQYGWVWNGQNFESSFGSSRRCGKRYHIHNSGWKKHRMENKYSRMAKPSQKLTGVGLNTETLSRMQQKAYENKQNPERCHHWNKISNLAK